MDADTSSWKAASRIPRKPERPYVSSFRPYPMETRKRPLRTYSKRTLSGDSSEPDPKRRCVNDSSVISYNNRAIPTISPTRSNASETLPGTAPTSTTASLPPMKKGTITAYFQKTSSRSSTATPSSDPISENTEPTTTPPSSPPSLITRKKRIRRLKARVAIGRIIDQRASDEDEGDVDGNKSDTGDIQARTCAPVLSETTINSLNQAVATTEPSTRSKENRSAEKVKKETKKASVQTTLSLSMRDTAYTECKECGMLYNHLDKADTKYHARHHTAILKEKTRAGAENEDDT
ncbi:hypothetical protein GGS20DRAFT_516547 [Poronia punctata]|nr:hypothetical protein GGS20DRAFT_516547 [Poronia punctata]